MEKKQIIYISIAAFLLVGAVGAGFLVTKQVNDGIKFISSVFDDAEVKDNDYANVVSSDFINFEDLFSQELNSSENSEDTNLQNDNISQSSSDLSKEEINGLLLMREEEKLARDVYLALYDKWNQPIFNNIAASENTHTEAIRRLLDQYNIQDPVTSDQRGVFQNAQLTKLYTDLVAKGTKSLEEALIVGATVEDLYIKDLENNSWKVYYSNAQIRGKVTNLNVGTQIKIIGSTSGSEIFVASEIRPFQGNSQR